MRKLGQFFTRKCNTSVSLLFENSWELSFIEYKEINFDSWKLTYKALIFLVAICLWRKDFSEVERVWHFCRLTPNTVAGDLSHMQSRA